jgi:hypothetical protein
MRMRRVLAVALAAGLAGALVAPAVAAVKTSGNVVRTGTPRVVKTGPSDWKVRRGGSIQAAVDAAQRGDTITIAPGTYRESVIITKNDITILGSGPRVTRLVPPPDLGRGPCRGNGICVFGKIGDHGQIRARTWGVEIRSVGLNKWPGMGLFAYGTAGLRLSNSEALHDGEYGFARFDSTGGAFFGNEARGAGEAGFYLGDTLHAHATIADNRAVNNNLGFFIRHSHGVALNHNVAIGNCQGILVLDDGQPEGAGNIDIRYNVTNKNNKFCAGGGEAPPLRGGGILLVGAEDTTVGWNVVRNNTGNQINSGGIVLLSAKQITGGAPLMRNLVTHNLAYGNVPKDIRYDGSGKHNRFVANACATSNPGSIC